MQLKIEKTQISAQAGYSITSVMITVALVAGVIMTISIMTKRAKKLADKSVQASTLMDLRYYIKSNFSCPKTLDEIGCGSTLEDVKTLRASGKTLTEVDGTMFHEFNIKAQCKDREFHFYYSIDENPWRHIQDSVPIRCKSDLDGNIAPIVNGLYHNPMWGYMLVEIQPDESVRAVYTFREGALVGNYNPDRGDTTAYWCERSEDHDEDDEEKGDIGTRGDGTLETGNAVFDFSFKDDDINLKGNWEYDRSDWEPDPVGDFFTWDLDKISDPDADELLVLGDLQTRLDDGSDFCYP